MCRFVYYQGPPIYISSLVTDPEHSLIHQSVRARMRKEPLNGDGFGIGWYHPARSGGEASEDSGRRNVGRFRSVAPAWSNRNLEELAEVVRSPRILAHVRAASPGSVVSEQNSHPFRFGSLLFMHNGDIGGFRSIRRPLLARLSDTSFHRILGSTDSEHFFALLQDGLGSDAGDRGGPGRMASAFRRALETVLELRSTHGAAEHIYLNAVVTDGRSTVVSRFTTDDPERSQTLFLSREGRLVCRDGEYRLVDDEEDGESIVISSEPLTSESEWDPIEPDSLVLIGEGGIEATVPVLEGS